MKITKISVSKHGPLKKINWKVPRIGVIYDDNMTGKTSLVDLLVRHLFVPRKNSQLFQGFRRFDSGPNYEKQPVKIEIETKESSFSFGTKSRSGKLKNLLDWPDESLFRLLCIREGENKLVLANRDRSSIFNAAASLISGVNSEKISAIDRELKERFRITKGNQWRNRKNTNPPKIKDRIENTLIPFLENFSRGEETLYLIRKKSSQIEQITEKINDKRKRKEKFKHQLNLKKAKELKESVREIEQINEDLNKFTRITTEDKEKWKTAAKKVSEAREKLENKDFKGLTLLERKEALSEEIAKKEELLEEKIESKIRSKKGEIRRLKREEANLREKIEKQRSNEVNFLKEKVRKPLKTMARKEERKRNLSFWAKNGNVVALISVLIALIAVVSNLYFPWPISFLAVPGIILTVFSRKKTTENVKLREEIDSTKTTIKSDFNSRFKNLVDNPVSDITQLEDILDEIPKLITKKAKRKFGLQEVRENRREVERKLEELQNRKRNLPARVKQLKTEQTNLKERIQKMKRKEKNNKKVLKDLKDKTNIGDLDTLKNRLNEKEKLKRELEEKKNLLRRELNVGHLGVNRLKEQANQKAEKLKETGSMGLSESESKIVEGDKSPEKMEGKIDDLEEEIENLREKLEQKREKLEELKLELAQFDINPEKPANLFRKRLEFEEELQDFILDRIAGSLARKILEKLSKRYRDSLKGFISGNEVGHTVEELFSEVMGEEFSLNFDQEKSRFLITENDLSYDESQLSSGARKHLLYSTRLALAKRITTEPAFFVLDDPYLFYEKKRKREAISQLKYFVEQGWQIICFTVDEGTRDGMVEELGASESKIADL